MTRARREAAGESKPARISVSRRKTCIDHLSWCGIRAGRNIVPRSSGSKTRFAGFERRDERSRLGLFTFLKQATGAKHALFQLLALSVALEILVLAGPFYLQLTVHEVIAATWTVRCPAARSRGSLWGSSLPPPEDSISRRGHRASRLGQ